MVTIATGQLQQEIEQKKICSAEVDTPKGGHIPPQYAELDEAEKTAEKIHNTLIIAKKILPRVKDSLEKNSDNPLYESFKGAYELLSREVQTIEAADRTAEILVENASNAANYSKASDTTVLLKATLSTLQSALKALQEAEKTETGIYTGLCNATVMQ